MPNNFWIIVRSRRQIFDGRMVTLGKLVKPRLSPDNRFYQLRVGSCFGWCKLNLRFIFGLLRPWDFNRALVVARISQCDLATGAATSDLSGKACSPHVVHWSFDTYGLAATIGQALVKQGGDTWFFITADYASTPRARCARTGV